MTGYALARSLKGLGIKCIVIAPSKIPQTPGPRVKTDRKDALVLAERPRVGELVPV